MKPTDFLGEKVIYDNFGQFLWSVERSGHHQKLADLRGWGAIQNLFASKKGEVDFDAASKFQDDLGQWIADAINEKLERERNG